MNDNLLSGASGSFTSITMMIIGLINVDTVIEVALFGFVGGLMGMLGKWLIQNVRTRCRSYFKKRKNG